MISTPCVAAADRTTDGPDDLVRRSQRGDVAAFDAIIERTYRSTFSLACRILGDRDAADDATQEIYIKAWQALPGFRAGSRFTTWLHAIAVRHCIDVARRRRRQAERAGPSAGDEALAAFAERPSPHDWELAAAVHAALQSLPEPLRVVVALHYFGDYTVEEIARALGKHPNTIYHRLRSAMARLQADLSDREAPR